MAPGTTSTVALLLSLLMFGGMLVGMGPARWRLLGLLGLPAAAASAGIVTRMDYPGSVRLGVCLLLARFGLVVMAVWVLLRAFGARRQGDHTGKSGRHRVQPTSRARPLAGAVVGLVLVGAVFPLPAAARQMVLGSCYMPFFPDAAGVSTARSSNATHIFQKPYVGPVSIRLTPARGTSTTRYAVLLHWGPWRRCQVVTTLGGRSVTLVTLKTGEDQIPLTVSAWPPLAVTKFTQGSPSGPAMDINVGWLG